MNKNSIYEVGFLLNPEMSQQEADEKVLEIEKFLTESGASVISKGENVFIDLAYQIITKIGPKNERFDKAYFSWIKFNLSPEKISDFKKKVEENKDFVFRFLITKTKEDDSLTDFSVLDIEEEEAEKKEDKKLTENIDKNIKEVEKEDSEKKVEENSENEEKTDDNQEPKEVEENSENEEKTEEKKGKMFGLF